MTCSKESRHLATEYCWGYSAWQVTQDNASSRWVCHYWWDKRLDRWALRERKSNYKSVRQGRRTRKQILQDAKATSKRLARQHIQNQRGTVIGRSQRIPRTIGTSEAPHCLSLNNKTVCGVGADEIRRFWVVFLLLFFVDWHIALLKINWNFEYIWNKTKQNTTTNTITTASTTINYHYHQPQPLTQSQP